MAAHVRGHVPVPETRLASTKCFFEAYNAMSAVQKTFPMPFREDWMGAAIEVIPAVRLYNVVLLVNGDVDRDQTWTVVPHKV